MKSEKLEVDNSYIEERAINELGKNLQKCNKLDTRKIAIGDNGLSWDGRIDVYRTFERSKTSYEGFVPVQVKGKWASKVENKKKIKYSVEVSDLKNYQKSNGVMFFVVNCNSTKGKVYYNSLMPFDLYWNLKGLKVKQKTVSIDFFPLPDNENDIYRVFTEFLYHQKLQGQLDETQIELFSGGIIPENANLVFGFSNVPKSINDSAKYILGKPTYVYAKPVGYNISTPIGKGEITAIWRDEHRPIVINGEKLYDGFKTTYVNDEEIISIGDNITLRRNNKLNFKYSSKLSERLRDFKFISFLMKEKYKNKPNEEIMYRNDGSSITYNNFLDELRSYKELQEALDIFGVKKDFEFLKIKENESHIIQAFVNSALYGKAVPFNFDGKPGFGILSFSNINIFVGCQKDNENNFFLVNPFSDLDVAIKYETEDESEMFWGSFYFDLKRNLLSKMDNFNADAVKQSILFFREKAFNVDVYDEQITLFILELLAAFDINGDIALLNLADELEKLLDCKSEESIYKPSYLINRKQIELRKGKKLTPDDVAILENLKQQYQTDFSIQACCCALLGDSDGFNLFKGKMDENEFQRFSDFPINNLCK